MPMRPGEEVGDAGAASSREVGGSMGAAWAVVQAGDRHVRLLLAGKGRGSLHVRRAVSVDLRSDALLTPEETRRHLRSILDEFGDADRAVILPPGRAVTQVMDAPSADPRSLRALALEAGGRDLDAGTGLFDAVGVPGLTGQPRAWVTVARASEVGAQLLRCGLAEDEVSLVTGVDHALVAAWRATEGAPRTVALVEIGSVVSTLVLMLDGVPVYSAALDTGGEGLVAALAQDLGCTTEHAEAVLRREENPESAASLPRFRSAVSSWEAEVRAALADGLREAGRPASDADQVPCWRSGTPLQFRFLRDVLAGTGSAGWPDIEAGGGRVSLAEFAAAWGAAAAGFGLVERPANLLPERSRAAGAARRRAAALHAVAAGLLVLVVLLLIPAYLLRRGAVAEKEERLERLRAVEAARPRIDGAVAARDQALVAALPTLYLQQRTRDLAAGLRTLRSERAKRPLWIALAADPETYAGPGAGDGPPASPVVLLGDYVARPTGLVVELSFEPSVADKLGALGELVNALRASGIYGVVDILPVRARRPLADPEVFAPESRFALALDGVPFRHGAALIEAAASIPTGPVPGVPPPPLQP